MASALDFYLQQAASRPATICSVAPIDPADPEGPGAISSPPDRNAEQMISEMPPPRGHIDHRRKELSPTVATAAWSDR
jgi:hypothetical protein